MTLLRPAIAGATEGQVGLGLHLPTIKSANRPCGTFVEFVAGMTCLRLRLRQGQDAVEVFNRLFDVL